DADATETYPLSLHDALPILISAEGTGFAYRTLRRCPGRADRWEFGAVGHGPHARATAEHLAHLIGEWDRDHRRGPGPRITLFPRSEEHTSELQSRENLVCRL